MRLSGWVHRVRDHGGLLFIDLRDHYGITQIVADPDSAAFKAAEAVRSEWVIRVDGQVRARPEGTVNKELPTGEVELFATEIEVLSAAKELPVPVFGEPDYPEDLRLQYRFLDLRRETLHANIMQRLAITASIRRRMTEAGFFEFSTPILTASSPEGARDFLVPSRIHAGKFYALPQAPQQYKQLLMMSGFDRYFQIAPCFRDEDPRADRLPGEFYQLDVEMSFVEQDDMFAAMEPVITGMFEEFAGMHADGGKKSVTQKLAAHSLRRGDRQVRHRQAGPAQPHRDAGRDRALPRLRLQDLRRHDREGSQGARVGDPGAGRRLPRLLRPHELLGAGRRPAGARLHLLSREGESGAGPVGKNLGPERSDAIRTQLGLKEGDAVFFTAGNPASFYKFAGEARARIGEELKLIDEISSRSPGSSTSRSTSGTRRRRRSTSRTTRSRCRRAGSRRSAAAKGDDDYLEIKAYQYDIVCNGFEIASGSVRNHRPDTMVKAFEITGLTQADVESRFGGLYRAFQYGAPPHGGMAAGIDRIVMLLVGAKNLREVSLFPMNQQANDLLMGAPSEVPPKQLRELSIRVVAPEKKGLATFHRAPAAGSHRGGVAGRKRSIQWTGARSTATASAAATRASGPSRSTPSPTAPSSSPG